MNTFNGALAIAVLAASGVLTTTHALASCEPDSTSSPVSNEQQQTLAARNFSNTAKFRVAEGGADRLKERQLASDGSDRLKQNQVAEGGAERLRERQLAADGSDRLKGNHYADVSYDYGANINAHYSMD